MGRLVFNNDAISRLSEDITDAQTVIKVDDPLLFLASGSGSDFFYAQFIDVDGTDEIIKVDVGASDPDGLVVSRGQEGTVGRNWPRGSVIWQAITKATLEGLAQQGGARQVAFNPNGILTSNYFGEKVYQSDLQVWWKSVAGGTTEWRLIAGVILVADVTFDPVPGTYTSGTTLEMDTITPSASIYYTDDGTDPDETDTLYAAPITMPDGSTTYKAKAFGANRWESPSNITTGAYTITAVPPITDTWTTRETFVNPTPYELFIYNGVPYGRSPNSYFLFYWDGSDFRTISMSQPYPSANFGSFNGYSIISVFNSGSGNWVWAGFDEGTVRYWVGSGTDWTTAGNPAGSGRVTATVVHNNNLYALRGNINSDLSRYIGGGSWTASLGQVTGGGGDNTARSAISDSARDWIWIANARGDLYYYDVSGASMNTAPGTKPATQEVDSMLLYSADGLPYMVYNGYLYKHDATTGFVQVTTNRQDNNRSTQMAELSTIIGTSVYSPTDRINYWSSGSLWDFSSVIPDSKDIRGMVAYNNEFWVVGASNRVYSWL